MQTIGLKYRQSSTPSLSAFSIRDQYKSEATELSTGNLLRNLRLFEISSYPKDVRARSIFGIGRDSATVFPKLRLGTLRAAVSSSFATKWRITSTSTQDEQSGVEAKRSKFPRRCYSVGTRLETHGQKETHETPWLPWRRGTLEARAIESRLTIESMDNNCTSM